MALVQLEEIRSQLLIITLNDPDRLNAMSAEMAQEMRSVQEMLQRKRYRAVILTGAGRAFSAGGDLEMLRRKQKLTGEQNREEMLQFYDSFLGLRRAQVPLIAAINGHAVGAGLCFASACDIRVAADSAKLGFTFTKLGLHPGLGATYFLPKIVGYAKAIELLLSARMISASEAKEVGLVSSVVPLNNLTDTVLAIAEEIGGCGPEATRQLLTTLRQGDSGLLEALQREALNQSINYASEEFTEGIDAVAQKRKASWAL